MRKTGNYGWWASGALTVALLAVAALVIWSQNAQASSGFNCQNPTYWDGRQCNARQIAIDTIVSYYNANKTKAHRNYGCNWYRVLRAFNRDGRWYKGNPNSSVGGSTLGPPDMSSPPDDLVRTGCAVTKPFTTAEAVVEQKKWAGWSSVVFWLGNEGGIPKTKTCPNGGTILESQQCPAPPEMLTCWDGSQIRYQPEVWRIDGVPDQQAREAQLRADCPKRDVVTPTITLSVGADVVEGNAHTWTLHASEATHVDLDVRVDFRAVGELVCVSSSCRWYDNAMFFSHDFNTRRLGGGWAESWHNGYLVTLPAGQTSVSFKGMGSTDDMRHTHDGTVTGTVVAGSGYVLGSPHKVKARVRDNDAVVLAPIVMPTVTIREGGSFAQIRVRLPFWAGPSTREQDRVCVTGHITLRPESGSQPDSSDYRAWFTGPENPHTFCSSQRPQYQFAYIMANRDHHNDNGERLTLGWEQTGGDGTAIVNEGSVTITNDGPLPAEWLARVGHGLAGQVVESVATRVFANRSPGEVEGSLGAMPAQDRPVTDGDALLMGSSASMTSHGGALAMWARADGTSFSSMTGGDGDVTTGHAGVDYVDGPLMFGLALARSEAEGSYRGGGGRMTSTIWRAT